VAPDEMLWSTGEGEVERRLDQAASSRCRRASHGYLQDIAYERQRVTLDPMNAQTLGFAVQPEDRPLLDDLVAYFGNGNRSAYLRATLKIMKSVMLADQLRDLQAYGQQRSAELGIEPGDVPARVQEFLKSSAGHSGP
jgi:hypothetical protein